MITLTIEAEDMKTLISKTAFALNLAVKGDGVLLDPALIQPMQNSPVQPSGKGRPKAATVSTAQASTDTLASSVGTANAAQDGSAQNTASAPAASSPVAEAAPAAGQATGSGVQTDAGSSAGQAAGPSFDDVKAKLKAVSDSPKGGIKKVIEILSNHGLTGPNAQIKNLKPEHFATAIAQANTMLAA